MRLAVIPARGGSKRVPKKNIRLFSGRPMINWSVEAVKFSGLFDRIIVSTDCPEVARVAEQAGAEAPFLRPAELSDDHASTLDVIGHAADWALAEGLSPQAICCVYATAPFITAEDLIAALSELTNGRWDYVFAAARFSQALHRSFSRDNTGAMKLLFPEHLTTRSQDLPTIFHDAGQFYWGSTEAWRQRRPIFGAASTFIELRPNHVQDIDTPEDWTMAEHLFAIMQRTNNEP